MATDKQVYHCDYAWLGGDTAARDVAISVENGVISCMTPSADRRPDATHLPGLAMPGLANTHSHVFHRAIRGHTQSGAADFWQWRKLMYGVASRLDPDSLYDLARATYTEMALSGITSVGEFFYVHHGVGGTRYDDPNEMGLAAIRAAKDAGIRITLLDTCYLQAGVDGEPVEGTQLRYSDGTWQAWAERVDALRESVAGDPMVRVGAAIHSVRGVPREAMGPIAEFCREREMPLHAHVSEQPAENEACHAVHGLTPVELLDAEGVLGPNATAVHATHLTDHDIELLGTSRTAVSMCCTTERDLADGVGPAIRLAAAGSPLCVGSDAHMMIDLWEEGRAIELDERLISGKRGHLSAGEIARAISTDGQATIGWPSDGLSVGAPADVVMVDLDSLRTAGARSGDPLAPALFAATSADVNGVILDGQWTVRNKTHAREPHPGRALNNAIAAVLR